MAETINYSIDSSDGWVQVAANPVAVTVKSNASGDDYPWFLAITPADVEPTVTGDLYYGPVSYLTGPFTGFLWLSVVRPINFSVTVED